MPRLLVRPRIGVYLRSMNHGIATDQSGAAGRARTLTGSYDVTDKSDIDVLHEIGSRIAAADPLHAVLDRVVQFVSTIVACDSCFVYVLEGDDLVLRASKTPAPRRRRPPDAAGRRGHHRLGGRASPARGGRPPRVGGSAVPDLQRAARGPLRGVPVGAGAVARQAGRRHQRAAPRSRTSTAAARSS